MLKMGLKKIYCLEIVSPWARRQPGTRKTHNIVGREQEYIPGIREAQFKAVDNYSNKCEIFRTVAIILELIIRKKKEISLERAKRHFAIWRHKADIDEKSVNQEDLVICNMQWKKSGYIKRHIISHIK